MISSIRGSSLIRLLFVGSALATRRELGFQRIIQRLTSFERSNHNDGAAMKHSNHVRFREECQVASSMRNRSTAKDRAKHEGLHEEDHELPFLVLG